MKTIPTIWLVTLLSVIIPMSIWHIIKAFVLGNCDPKFGCFGSVQLSVFILVICAFISAFAVLAAYLINKKIKYIECRKYTIVSTIIIGTILSFSTSILLSSTLGSTFNMVIAWLVASFAIGFLVYLVNGLLLPKKI